MDDEAEYETSPASDYVFDKSLAKERLLLSYLISNEDAWALSGHIIRPDLFVTENQDAVGYVIGHVDKYKQMPTPDMVAAETGVRLELRDDAKDPRRARWLLDEVEKFCRLKATINAVWSSMDKIEKGELDDLVGPIKDAVMISLQRDLGTDYWHDPLTRLRRMLENNVVPTGFRDLDDVLFGGVSRGTVSFTLAGSGVGKSVLLANLALNYAERGMNALYISFELSEDMVAKRADSMVTGIGTRDVFKRMEEVADRVRLTGRKSGRLQIKYMPAGSSAAEVEAYVREYVLRTGAQPDVLCLDYLDLMSPKAKVRDFGNLWVVGKYVTEEVRALAGEFNMICFTASQMTRGAMDEEEHRQSHIAGGISKINTADNVWSMYQSIDMKEQGLYQLQLLKTRSSSGVGKRIMLCVNPETLRVTDAPPEMRDGKRPGAPPSVSKLMAETPQAFTSNSERLERLKARINRT